MSQTFFVWTHGGTTVKLAGTFNNWAQQPLTKQGNYFFGALDLGDGFYQYKFVVDGKWLYDINQVHVDDGSGNWNNLIEVGSVSAVVQQPIKPQKEQHQQQPQHQPEKQQPPKEQKQQQQKQPQKQQQQPQGDQPKSKKQLKREENQRKKEQQQQKQAEPEPEPEAAPAEPEAAPEPEAQPEAEAEAEQPEAEAEPEAEAAAEVEPEAEAEVDATPEPPKKVLISIITLEVVAQQDANLEELEKFVRSIERPGLKWEGSAIKPHVFGMMKLEIICQARDDVAVEDDVCKALEANEDLVAGATILGFSC